MVNHSWPTLWLHGLQPQLKSCETHIKSLIFHHIDQMKDYQKIFSFLEKYN